MSVTDLRGCSVWGKQLYEGILIGVTDFWEYTNGNTLCKGDSDGGSSFMGQLNHGSTLMGAIDIWGSIDGGN